jgi:hypothetical protein
MGKAKLRRPSKAAKNPSRFLSKLWLFACINAKCFGLFAVTNSASASSFGMNWSLLDWMTMTGSGAIFGGK